MPAYRSLRDVRHLDKHYFTYGDAVFYEPLEAHYKPKREYTDIVTQLLNERNNGWQISQEGLWFHVHPLRYSLPRQEWKIHVSATLRNSPQVLQEAARIALQQGVSFKFALDRNILGVMGSKRWRRGSSGKFITMYPLTPSSFTSLLEDLYAALRAYDGPYILSDKRYRDCRVLYYRYGGMKRTTEMEITGVNSLVIVSPDGEKVRDVRSPYFAPPPWASDPFPTERRTRQQFTLCHGKYVIEKALAFSNSGGIYLAADRDTGLDVIIKEARPHTVIDGRGQDACKRLEKEYQLLELFSDTGITPKPRALFQEWEHTFLAQEFLDGLEARKVMLEQSPLLRVNPSHEDTIQYYNLWKTIFQSLAETIEVVHSRGVVFGDLSPNNIKVDVVTNGVRLIDFEVAMRPGVDEPTVLYTPGFKKDATNRQGPPTREDDLYGLAAVMLYMLFPITVLSSIRGDLFENVLKVLVDDLGWKETPVASVLHGLAGGEITLKDAVELMEQPARILPPAYGEDVDLASCHRMVQELGAFLLANMRPEAKGSLFPADPFVHETNYLSLGFGACGVLFVLKKCGFEIPACAHEWLERQIDEVKPGDLAPGLFTGASGIAWALCALGYEDRALEFMRQANQSPILHHHHSYFYGMAGVGMANLHLYRHTGNLEYLEAAIGLADALLRMANENDKGVYWEAESIIHLGYGYGQSGVALFLLRIYQVTRKTRYLEVGRRALDFDVAHAVEAEPGVLSFPHSPSDTTLLPYMEQGSAGIAKVALRYGLRDRLSMILSEAHRKYAGFPGLVYGLGSFIDVFTDAYLFSSDPRYLEMAKRPIAGIRDLYYIRQAHGAAIPGDGLFRVSCDYATGVAGVLRALHRYAHREKADLSLDDIAAATGDLAGNRYSLTRDCESC